MDPGSYSFSAYYPGDDDYNEAFSSCEPLAIGESPLVVTEIHIDRNHLTAVTEIDTGTNVHDSAMVSGSLGTPEGTVTFSFYTNGTCGDNAAFPGTVGLDAGGVADPSDSQLNLTPGSYSFKAHYNGESPYFPADSDGEPLLVADPD